MTPMIIDSVCVVTREAPTMSARTLLAWCARRFRGATAIVDFGVTHYQWETLKFCIELAHLRVLVTPSPLTPVTPHFKRSMILGHHSTRLQEGKN